MIQTSPSPQIVLPGPERGPWWLFQCLPKLWREFRTICTNRGIPTFIPTMKQRERIGVRDCTVESPLWFDYGFLRGGEGDAVFADETERLVSIQKVAMQERLTEELSQVADALNRGALLGRSPMRHGDKARIAEGPLMGITGVVDAAHPGKLFLNAGLLGSSIDVTHCELEPIQ